MEIIGQDPEIKNIPIQTLFHLYGKPNQTSASVYDDGRGGFCVFYWLDKKTVFNGKSVFFDISSIMEYDTYPNISEIYTNFSSRNSSSAFFLENKNKNIELRYLIKSDVISTYEKKRAKKIIDENTKEMCDNFIFACLGGKEGQIKFWRNLAENIEV